MSLSKAIKICLDRVLEKDFVCDCMVIPVTEEDIRLDGLYGKMEIEKLKLFFPKDHMGKRNESFLIPSFTGAKAERILFIGIGKGKEISSEAVRQAGGKTASVIRSMNFKSIGIFANALESYGAAPADFLEGLLLGSYSFLRYKKEKSYLERITILSDKPEALTQSIRKTETLASAICFARNLINTPANDMNPGHLADSARVLSGKQTKVSVKGKKEVERLGMGAYLAVARGSAEPLRFIELRYSGSKDRPIVLIGKSITFDSGGVSLKPAEGMEKMKYDMAGGAAVLGVIKAASELRIPAHIIGILPATENMPGGAATKPGDVVRALDGTTIEIINTDAEGRLVLADAIAYAQKFKPRAIVDIATLTGAASMALGQEAIVMMGNNSGLVETMKKAGERTHERVWEMPLFEEYEEYLKSDIADMKNYGGRSGSLATSAYFLSKFAKDTPWIHLDIAGTAWSEKDGPYLPKGATAIGVRLLIDFITELK